MVVAGHEICWRHKRALKCSNTFVGVYVTDYFVIRFRQCLEPKLHENATTVWLVTCPGRFGRVSNAFTKVRRVFEKLWDVGVEMWVFITKQVVKLTTALQLVHDASAKLQSGLLNGNVNNFGDFDYCLNVDAPNDEFQGKYCLAYLQPTVTATLMYTNYLRRLMQSHGPFTSNFDDVSNWFGPR